MIDITNNITFIIPVYNAESTIERCILSIINYLPEAEIIIIDDGSIDSTREICQRLKKTTNHITVIYNQNYGVSHSRNCGIEHCQTDYLFFVDADDQILGENIKKTLQNFESSVDVLKFGYNICQRKKTKKIVFEDTIFNICEKKHRETMNFNFFSSPFYNTVWGTIISKKILQKHKLRFREDLAFAEDIFFNVQLYNACNRIQFTHILGYSYDNNSGVTKTFNYDILMRRISNVLKVFSEFLIFDYLDSSLVAQKCLFEIFPQIMRLSNYCSKKKWLTMISEIVSMPEYQVIRKNFLISSYQGKYRKILSLFLNEKYSIVYFYSKYVYIPLKEIQNLKNRMGV